MPIRHCIVHLIDKKPDGTPAVLHARDTELGASQAIENMLADLNESYNAKQGKAWGFFHAESGAYPFSGWLKNYREDGQDFAAFSRQAVEQLQKLMEESNLSAGGQVGFFHQLLQLLHRLAAEGGEILAVLPVVLQPAAKGIGPGFGVEETPGLALLGVVALVEVGQHILDGLGRAQLGIPGMQHGGRAIGLLVDQVDDAVADRHADSLQIA